MAKQSFVIGRAGDITLYDDTVSRRHACLEVDGDELFLRDLDSRNGTYEIREKKLVPFSAGRVTRDQVFAFGECVRSVTQLLDAVRGASDVLADTAGRGHGEHAGTALDATQIGFSVEPRRRLSPDDIVELLERVEDELAAGRPLEAVCAALGITEQRYQRWCREHGGTRAERDRASQDVRRENERLRRLVADLSLECEVLKEALRAQQAAAPRGPAPNLSIVGDGKG